MYKNIFQTHKSEEYIHTKQRVLDACNSWRQYANQGYNYHFYDDKMCDDFIRENYDEDTYRAYSRLPMSVMKADLWRYCIIYKYGGIYADTDTICRIDPYLIVNNSSLLTIVPENDVHLCNWIFYAPVNSPILKSVIDLSVKLILEIPEIKGEHIIHILTGPGVFTRGIELYLQQNNLPTYQNKTEYTNYVDANTLVVFEAKNFHSESIIHLYTGQDEDGWCKERELKLRD
jgi:mannosyltransferase OCH1-like enzyme